MLVIKWMVGYMIQPEIFSSAVARSVVAFYAHAFGVASNGLHNTADGPRTFGAAGRPLRYLESASLACICSE